MDYMEDEESMPARGGSSLNCREEGGEKSLAAEFVLEDIPRSIQNTSFAFDHDRIENGGERHFFTNEQLIGQMEEEGGGELKIGKENFMLLQERVHELRKNIREYEEIVDMLPAVRQWEENLERELVLLRQKQLTTTTTMI